MDCFDKSNRGLEKNKYYVKHLFCVILRYVALKKSMMCSWISYNLSRWKREN